MDDYISLVRNQLHQTYLIVVEWYLEIKSDIQFLWGPYFQWCQPIVSSMDYMDIFLAYSFVLLMLYFLISKISLPPRNYNDSKIQTTLQIDCFAYFKTVVFKMIVKYVPGVGSKIAKQRAELVQTYDKLFDNQTFKKTFRIPDTGMTQEKLQERLTEWTAADNAISQTGRLSGTLYVSKAMLEGYEEEMMNFAKNYVFTNTMHFDIFPSIAQMEADVVKMTGNLFGQKEGIGIVTGGGTESILMAILSYRNWARDTKNVTQPNMVIPETAHAAFYKAGHYFGIQVRIARPTKYSYVDVKHVKKLIDSNTVCIVGSCPNYPHGIKDPIEELSEIASKRNVGLHVDCCLGGFVVAFAKENGVDIGQFDFGLKGVTTISCDHHKYGLAPKGASIVLFKTQALREYAFFAFSDWPGNLYGTTTLCGSRSAVGIAGAWFAMLRLGRKAYAEQSKKIMDSTKEIAEMIRGTAELELIGDPQICVVSFRSKVKRLNIYAIQDELSNKKKWNLSSCQNPAAIHISLTLNNTENKDDLMSNIYEILEDYRHNPKKFMKSSTGSVYGTTQKIPDAEFLNNTVCIILDAFLKT